MTVFAPVKKSRLHLLTYFLVFTLVIVSAAWLYLYVTRVALNSQLAELESSLKEIKVSNAELKHELYTLLNPSDLDEFASRLNLIKETNPSFLEIAQN